jgi:hypothetical protein
VPQINLYEPAILVVGTRGRSLGGFQGLLPGSVSKYCLQHSPVPVIVVRPSSKRDKARVKRARDPSRHGYKDLLEKSGPQGGPLHESGNRNSFIAEEDVAASDDEAAAVATAIGYRAPVEPSPLAQVLSANPGVDDDAASTMDDLRSPGIVMKSPELQNLDSPEISDVSSSDEEDEGGVPTASEAQDTNDAVDEVSTKTEDVKERVVSPADGGGQSDEKSGAGTSNTT